MNSDFVAERAMNVAQSLAQKEPDPAKRVQSAYWTMLDRAASPDEVDGGLSYIASFRKKVQQASELEAWQSFCRILLASDDYIYVD